MVTDGIGVTEQLTVALVDCVPPPEPVVSVPLPEAPEVCVTQQIQAATVEQTGADPPPVHQTTSASFLGDPS